MQVSFVIPAYNEERYLGGCLRSIYKEIERSGVAAEVVVVDNASTDRTAEVARTHGALVLHEPHKGVVRARQRGLEQAQGELLANVDADNEIPPGWITIGLERFAREPRLVGLSGPYIYSDTSLFSRAFIWFLYACAQALAALVPGGSMLQGGGVMMRKSALQKIGGYDMRIEFYGDDTDLARQLSRVGRVRWSREFFVYASPRRLRAEGVVRSILRYMLNSFGVIVFGKPLTTTYTDVR